MDDLRGGGSPPGLYLKLSTLRYYLNQALVNPKFFMTNVLGVFRRKKKQNVRKWKDSCLFKEKIKFSEGGFGKIYKSMVKLPGYYTYHQYAVKSLRTKKPTFLYNRHSNDEQPITPEDMASIELEAFESLQPHPFILQFIYSIQKKHHLIIITEFCPYRDLAEIMVASPLLPQHSNRSSLSSSSQVPHFSVEMVQFLCSPLFDACKFMHSKGFIHRDLKPQNFVVDRLGTPKLCDFGLTCKMRDRKDWTKLNERDLHGGGSGYYMALEIACLEPFGITADTWQMGISMLVLILGYGPYNFRRDNVIFDFEPGMTNEEVESLKSNFRIVANDFRGRRNESQDYEKWSESRIFDWLYLNDTEEVFEFKKNEEEEKEKWDDMKRFLRRIMKRFPLSRPTCEQICQMEYIKEALTEWKDKHFVRFRETRKEWEKILNASF